MKLSAAEAESFIARPRRGVFAALFHGEDQARTRDAAERLAARWLGPQAEDELRLTRLDPAALTADDGALDAALRTRGFFPGALGVIVSGASDRIAPVVLDALSSSVAEDAVLIVTARQLRPASALRKSFEADNRAAAVAYYDDPPTAADIRAALAGAGASADADATEALLAAAQALGRAELASLVGSVALLAEGRALTAEDVARLAPPLADDDLAAPVEAALAGDAAAVRRALGSSWMAGVDPSALAASAARMLHRLCEARSSMERDGLSARNAAERLRPKPFGPARMRVESALARWSVPTLEASLREVQELEGALRGGSNAPRRAVTERHFLRLAMRRG